MRYFNVLLEFRLHFFEICVSCGIVVGIMRRHADRKAVVVKCTVQVGAGRSRSEQVSLRSKTTTSVNRTEGKVASMRGGR
jgi:hypothetical protein